MFHSGLNGKERRNQTKQAKFTPPPRLCAPVAFENVSQRSGSPGMTIILVFTQYAQSLTGFTELFGIAAQFFAGTQVNIYAKASFHGRRQT